VIDNGSSNTGYEADEKRRGDVDVDVNNNSNNASV